MYIKCNVSDTSHCIRTDLPNEMAWGSKKKIFYDSDYVTKSKHLHTICKDVQCIILFFALFYICLKYTYSFALSKKHVYFAEGKSLQEIEAEDKEEEEEAQNIQRRLAANMSEEDYDLNLLEVLHYLSTLKTSTNFRCLPPLISLCTISVRSLQRRLKQRSQLKRRKGLLRT